MRRGVRRAPSRKRKLGGRAKGGRESAAVNSFYRAALLPSVWASLRLREMVRSGSRSGQTETVQGLDGCASLLQDILRNEDSVSSDKKKHIPNEASAGSERDSSDIPQNWSLQDHYRMYSPIIYQALCEHVQTQMSLMNNLASKNNPNGIPTVPCQTMSDSESQATVHSSYGLSTSTPVQLLQHPSCPPVVHSEVQTDGDNQFASRSKTVSVNCADVLQNSFSTGLGVPCSLPKTDKPAVPPFQQLGLINGILPQQGVPKEPDLLKCIQTYVNLLHSHPDSQIRRSPTLLPPAFLSSNEDKCAKEQIGEVTSEGKDLNIHMQDSRIKDVQKAKNVNQKDSEIQRLITELEACISLLPALSGNTNIQVEIALAMQPLRSENAQLR
ncbi:hypothetical protein GH733_002975, partial [Mirounga leonina]